MKGKARFIVLLAFALVVFASLAQSAFAGTHKTTFANGVYAISSSGQSPIILDKSSDAKRTSGTGGSPSSSGSRTAWITTKYYALSGGLMISYKTSIYWEWRGSTVTNKHWLTPQQTTPGPFVFYVNSTNGDSGWQTWNRKSHGQWYGSKTGHFVQQVTKLGTIKRWHPLHEYWIRGNGTYTWHAHE